MQHQYIDCINNAILNSTTIISSEGVRSENSNCKPFYLIVVR